MMSKKSLSITALIILVLGLAAYLLLPRPTEPYTQASLDKLNREGKPVLLAIHADWCSTCKTQEKVLQELLSKPEFKQITLLRMDFDQQKAAVRSFGVQYQSTLIAFKDGHEVARSTAEQSPVRIAELLRMTL